MTPVASSLSTQVKRTYPLHEYQTNEAIPISYCPKQLVASTATAHSGSLLILLLPLLLSLICSLSRRLAAPQRVFYPTVCILCSGPVLLLQGYIVELPLWIQYPGSGRCQWAEQSS